MTTQAALWVCTSCFLCHQCSAKIVRSWNCWKMFTFPCNMKLRSSKFSTNIFCINFFPIFIASTNTSTCCLNVYRSIIKGGVWRQSSELEQNAKHERAPSTNPHRGRQHHYYRQRSTVYVYVCVWVCFRGERALRKMKQLAACSKPQSEAQKLVELFVAVAEGEATEK